MADISITAANVLRSATSVPTSVGIIAAGVTVTQGQALYQLANGTYGLADSNASSPANSFAGISLTAGSPGQPVLFCNSDTAFVTGGTLVFGQVYVSNTPGALTQSLSDLATGSTMLSIGAVNTDGTLKLSPVVGGVK